MAWVSGTASLPPQRLPPWWQAVWQGFDNIYFGSSGYAS